jgi:two-component system chemotaxis sensor kinase CheA
MQISEYKQLFISEAREILNSLNNVLVDLEKEPDNIELLNELFRQSHTMKSMAQSMGYDGIAKLTHSMETTLALLRSGESKLKRETVDLLFKSMDTLSDLVKERANGEEGEAGNIEVAPLVAQFEEISSTVPQEKTMPVDNKRSENKQKETKSMTTPVNEIQSVRVPLTQLDDLMDLTGELAISRIRLEQIVKAIDNSALAETVAHLTRLTSRLQDQMMQIRLVPLEYIFAPFPRLIRDVSVQQSKEVDFIIEGGDIGLDRSIQDEITEPLLHLLKNAVTHGIEESQEREKLKKPGRGKVKLSARRERNSVVVELSDDGHGVDIEEIRKVALEKGIVTEKELSALSPREIIMLTTRPGYSRVKEVTEAAGRGVGLNAAKLKIESLGGTLEIDTKVNEGSTFSIKLPLTMAIAQAMLVSVADQTYCIPLTYVNETIKISQHQIKTIEHREVISYRDGVLPLVGLKRRFGFESSEMPSPVMDVKARKTMISVVVVETGEKKVGLVVDSFLGQQEIVIKPLTGLLKEIKGASGATILGTGKPALIMDVASLI